LGSYPKSSILQNGMSNEDKNAENNEEKTKAKVEFSQAYQSGQAAFEGGEYRLAVSYLQKAIALGMAQPHTPVPRNSRLGGEAQVWLVTAYEASGDLPAAIELCRKLTKHIHPEVSKQAKRLLYILEAPQLVRPASWMSEIPDLGNISDRPSEKSWGSSQGSIKKSTPLAASPEKPVDLSQVNTQDNNFIWVAIMGAIALLVSLGISTR
jgi:tetratricopeptide (TPR) repeat protein